MLNWLRGFVTDYSITVIMLSALALFLGLALAVKMDTKWGYVFAAAGAALGLFTLYTIGIFNL